jgi:hypothetical protein
MVEKEGKLMVGKREGDNDGKKGKGKGARIKG